MANNGHVADATEITKYDHLFQDVQERVLDENNGFDAGDNGFSPEVMPRLQSFIAQTLLRLQPSMPRQDAELVASRFAMMMTGLGILEPILHEPDVEEIIVREGFVQVERNGVIEDRGNLAPDKHFYHVAQALSDSRGKTLRVTSPFVLTHLPSGDRFTAVVPPLSVRGTAINIRVFGRRKLTLDDINISPRATSRRAIRIQGEWKYSDSLREFLSRVARFNLGTVLIAGAFSTGKTSLLNALSFHFPHTMQLAVVESFQELQLDHPHPLRAVVTDETKVDMAEVVNVLYTRMRPDVIVVGEVASREAKQFLTAANLGVKAYTTIHGNTPLDALYRLEMLAASAGDAPLYVVRDWVGRGIDLIIFMDRDSAGHRYIASVHTVTVRDNKYVLNSLYEAETVRSASDELADLYRTLNEHLEEQTAQ